MTNRACLVALVVKNLSDSGSVRSPGGGHGNTLQYSSLENSMDRGAWHRKEWDIMETTQHACTMSNNVEYLFICLFATMYLLCPLKKIGMVTSSLLSFGLLVYFEYKPFIRQVLQIFSPACGLPFYSLNSIFWIVEVLNSEESNSSIFFFSCIDRPFVVRAEK